MGQGFAQAHHGDTGSTSGKVSGVAVVGLRKALSHPTRPYTTRVGGHFFGTNFLIW